MYGESDDDKGRETSKSLLFLMETLNLVLGFLFPVIVTEIVYAQRLLLVCGAAHFALLSLSSPSLSSAPINHHNRHYFPLSFYTIIERVEVKRRIFFFLFAFQTLERQRGERKREMRREGERKLHYFLYV